MTRAITTKRVPCTETLPARIRVQQHRTTRFYSVHRLQSLHNATKEEDLHATALQWFHDETGARLPPGTWVAGDLGPNEFVWVKTRDAYSTEVK